MESEDHGLNEHARYDVKIRGDCSRMSCEFCLPSFLLVREEDAFVVCSVLVSAALPSPFFAGQSESEREECVCACEWET